MILSYNMYKSVESHTQCENTGVLVVPSGPSLPSFHFMKTRESLLHRDHQTNPNEMHDLYFFNIWPILSKKYSEKQVLHQCCGRKCYTNKLSNGTLHLALASWLRICASIVCLASSIACCLSCAFAWLWSPVP